MHHDFCVIGGGIIGLATAHALLRRHPKASLALLEKESTLGAHQSGHNSGVIHAGVYYPPGSLKAQLCRKGAEATRVFCKANGIPYQTRGKLIVAVSPDEAGRLEALQRNAQTNGLDVILLDRAGMREHEPNVEGIGALLVSETGIVDYTGMCMTLGRQLDAMGAQILVDHEVETITETSNKVEIRIGDNTITAGHVVVCGGLQADRLARLSGLDIDFRIIPFRGEYYVAPKEKSATFSHLIYPVPDPSMPFLGVHFTPTVDGQLTIGPNAVLGFAREGYRKFSFSPQDFASTVSFPGLWRLAAKHWRFGAGEFRDSLWKRAYLDKCRQYWPTLELGDLRPRAAGIRAQAVTRDGTMIHDFLFAQSDRVLHVCNAPSPAATSAIPIAEMITDKLDVMRTGNT